LAHDDKIALFAQKSKRLCAFFCENSGFVPKKKGAKGHETLDLASRAWVLRRILLRKGLSA
jgi:hypothetical protein